MKINNINNKCITIIRFIKILIKINYAYLLSYFNLSQFIKVIQDYFLLIRQIYFNDRSYFKYFSINNFNFN